MTSSVATMPTRRTGNQRPRIEICPEYATTYGDDAAKLAETYAYSLIDWEKSELDKWLARDEDGRPIAITIGLCVPRQNGKNYCIEIFELFCAVALGWHILHTAHEVKTSMKAFNRVCSYFDGPTSTPEMRALVKRIRRTNGQESIELTNGGIIEFSARSRQAARGFDDIQVLILDEAQEITPEQMDALNATLAASSTGTRQVIWTGTPTPPTSAGTVFAKVRRQIIKGEIKNAILSEWSVDECPDENATFDELVDLIYETNPSMGYTLDIEFTEEEFATLTIDGFARERLGWWVSLEVNALITEEDWKACSIESVPDFRKAKKAYGVKFALDGSISCLAVAARYEDGREHIEVIDTRGAQGGSMWIARWLSDHRDDGSCVVIDGLYGRDVLVNKLEKEHLFPKKGIVKPESTQVATAATMLKEGIESHDVTWYAKQERLSHSVLSCERRPIGNRGAWGFGGPDPTPAEACSLALWGLRTTKRDSRRKLRVG